MKAETKELVILEGSIENIPPSSIIMLLYNLRKSGILRFTIDAFIIKSIYFRNGNVVFATSTRNDDRLGESLVRNGLISKSLLHGPWGLIKQTLSTKARANSLPKQGYSLSTLHAKTGASGSLNPTRPSDRIFRSRGGPAAIPRGQFKISHS